MEPMGFIAFLIIGLIAGYIAEKVTQSDHGLLTNLIVGVIGAYVGGFLANLIGIQLYGILGGLVVATLGAILCLFIWRRIRG